MKRNFIPRPYQRIGADHIIKNPRCGIWVPVGGGKCSIVFMAFDELAMVEDVFPTLIIAPKRVAKETWPNEIDKWEEFKHITISPVIGTESERIAALKKKAMYYTVNPECIEWLIEYLGDAWPFKNIVFDESSRLRGFRLRQGTKRTRILSTRAHTHTRRFVELTGSPSPNGLEGTWGQLHFIDQGVRLGRSFEAFKQRWFRQGWDGYSMEPMPHAEREIISKISDVCLSIDLKDYFDLKKPVENKIFVELPKEARRLYKDMEKQFFMELKGHPIEALNAAAKSGKLLQIANGAAYIDDTKKWEEIHKVKIEGLESLVEESNGTPIFTVINFVSDRERLLKHFPTMAVDLATDKGFKEFLTGKKLIGLAHPASLGHGVDGLQYVTNIIAFFGLNWDLELHDQIKGRIGPTRQAQAGFERNVFEHYIIAKGTIDELVFERLKSKRKVQDILMDALKARV